MSDAARPAFTNPIRWFSIVLTAVGLVLWGAVLYRSLIQIRLFHLAEKAVGNEEYNVAYASLKRLLEKDPEHLEALDLLAGIYQQFDNPSEVAARRKMVEITPGDYARVRDFVQAGLRYRTVDHLGYLPELSRYYSDHAGYHVLLSVWWLSVEDIDRSLHHAERALELDPEHTESRFNRASIALYTSEAAQGEQELERMVEAGIMAHRCQVALFRHHMRNERRLQARGIAFNLLSDESMPMDLLTQIIPDILQVRDDRLTNEVLGLLDRWPSSEARFMLISLLNRQGLSGRVYAELSTRNSRDFITVPAAIAYAETLVLEGKYEELSAWFGMADWADQAVTRDLLGTILNQRNFPDHGGTIADLLEQYQPQEAALLRMSRLAYYWQQWEIFEVLARGAASGKSSSAFTANRDLYLYYQEKSDLSEMLLCLLRMNRLGVVGIEVSNNLAYLSLLTGVSSPLGHRIAAENMVEHAALPQAACTYALSRILAQEPEQATAALDRLADDAQVLPHVRFYRALSLAAGGKHQAAQVILDEIDLSLFMQEERALVARWMPES
ncbi:MAG: hypothetical protein AAF649_07390 [Verrucomicrobiota bacterium]